ncbi:MAG: hypothetical protein PVJ67_03875 [Candidatus Pacearchaeota archaeon]
MAKKRSIKPEFWASEQVMNCSKNARLLFIGLWNFCDDNGIHQYSFRCIKAKIFPADSDTESEIEQLLNELEKNNLIKIYTVNDKKYLKISGWHHQSIARPFYKFPDEDGNKPLNKWEKIENIHEQCSSSAQAVPEQCSSSAQAAPEQCSSSAQAAPEQCSSSAQAVPEQCSSSAQAVPKHCGNGYGYNTDLSFKHNSNVNNQDKNFKESKNARVRASFTVLKNNSEFIAKFDKFYAVYPLHKSKEGALKAFAQINPDNDLLDKILIGVENYKQEIIFMNIDKKYIKHPSTWLNQKCWLDEIDLTQQQSQQKKLTNQQQFVANLKKIAGEN